MKKIKDVFEKFWWILAFFELLAIPWTIREYIHLTHRLHNTWKIIMSDTQAIGLFLFTGIIFLILYFLIKLLFFNVFKNKQKTKDIKTTDSPIPSDDDFVATDEFICPKCFTKIKGVEPKDSKKKCPNCKNDMDITERYYDKLSFFKKENIEWREMTSQEKNAFLKYMHHDSDKLSGMDLSDTSESLKNFKSTKIEIGYNSCYQESMFLNKSYDELFSFYSKETDLLKIPWGNQMKTIPVKVEVEADWTADPQVAAEVKVLRENSEWKMAAQIEAITKPALEKYRIFLKNRKPVREEELNLRVAHLDIDRKLIKLQAVPYIKTMQTNYTIDYKHEGMTLRQYIHPNGRLQLLNDSTLADHIGIDILLFSFEGLLILGRRSCNMVTVTGGKIGPFGAGALKAADLPLKFGQLSLTNLNLLRELYDESGLNEKDIIKENIYVLGITRDLLRGGKPQLSLCVRSKLIAEDIFKKHPTAETSYEHDNLIKIDLGIGLESIYKVSEDKLDEVGRKLGEKLSELGKEMTEPLLGALALWWRSVSRNKKAL